MNRQDYFSIHELHYLIGAFEETVLIGLPTLEELGLQPDDIWEITKDALIEKELLTEDSKLTEPGYMMVEILKEYCDGRSLTIIDNYYFMMHEHEESAILIVDSGDNQYQIAKLGVIGRLAILENKFSKIVMREPFEDETTFLTLNQELTPELEEQFLSDDTVVIQHFPLEQMANAEKRETLKKQYLFNVINNQLLGYDILGQTITRFSQYYFLRQLYLWLAIPFQKEADN